MHIINGLGFGYLHLLFNEVCINSITQEKKYAAFDWIGRLKIRMNTILNNYLAIESPSVLSMVRYFRRNHGMQITANSPKM